ncbi:protein HEAT-INDUCED TAS1 TARGET 4 isoform X2 [Brassica rapa]|uniref:Peptidase C1A papain C-terminal domain-containing protein n=2 Tax=Brassica campestris TaxID=3711 RepID=A0A3P5Z2M7_BRACM|nr:protein HEAT-INDUCED TAS1 TARGET 4 isoform X2 [Brassica rapa]XP_048637338.1 protein HEAT-INDUCED TAS1 TARGET 4-like isoform X2 [Brassica napus]CAG7886766.1 unnamed protein product [Brassica rapa]VDC74296.1 unnamed protein product [Brassica rapa]
MASSSSSPPQVLPAEEILHICQETTQNLAHILSIIPSELLSLIMSTIPKSEIKVVKGLEASYARWRVSRVVRDILMSKDWASIMGAGKFQGFCESCWAFATAELVSAVLYLKRKDTNYTEYSVQELMDRADRSRIEKYGRKGHFCYRYSIRRGLEYVLKNGLQRAVDCPYNRCREESQIPPRALYGLAHIDGIDKLSLSQALLRLEEQPIGASLFIFMPDYVDTKEGVYRGPMTNRSFYKAMHGVSVVSVVEENGEKLWKVRLNHGSMAGHQGYLKVSMEVMLVRVPTEGSQSDGKFDKPSMLLTDFVCPNVV